MKITILYIIAVLACLPVRIAGAAGKAAPHKVPHSQASVGEVDIEPSSYNPVIVLATTTGADHQVRTLRLLVDTGSDVTLSITSRAASLLGAKTKDVVVSPHTPSAGRFWSSRFAYMPPIVLGNQMNAKPGWVPIVDLPNDMPDLLDGVIGIHVLRQFPVEFDFDAQMLDIYAGAKDEQSLLTLADMRGAKPIPLHFDGEHLYSCICRVSVQGKAVEMPMTIDTGCDTSFVTRRYSGRFAASGLPITAHFMGAEPYPASVVSARLESIGGLPINTPIVSTLNTGGPDPAAGSLIGMSILRRFRVLFDFAHNRMYLKPRKSECVEVPGTVNSDGLPSIEAGLNGITIGTFGMVAGSVNEINNDVLPGLKDHIDASGIADGQKWVILDGLSIGKMKLPRLYCQVGDRDGGDTHIGHLGSMAMADFNPVIDYNTHKVSLLKFGVMTDAVLASAGMTGAVSMDMVPLPDDSGYAVPLQLTYASGKQTEVDALLDTGSTTSLPASAATALGINPVTAPGNNATWTMKTKVASAWIGNVEITDFGVSFDSTIATSVDPDGNVPSNPPTLGSDFLSRAFTRVLIDYRDGRLYGLVRPQTPTKSPANP